MMHIDLPAQKEVIWQKMRSDLISLVPSFADNELLLCPACCRRIRYEDASVEHILPKQALACDPVDVKQAVSQNERSGLTLLCRKPLVFNGKRLPGAGCNSWKGKHYDPFLRELLTAFLPTKNFSSRHQIALYCAGYLALVRKFGFQVALSAAGLLSRKQFFHPHSFLRDVPLNCQIMLGGEPLSNYEEENRSYWTHPFNIHIEQGSALIVARNIGFRVPLSRDPTQPFARVLPYVPPKLAFRPDLSTFFD